ncbi:hypothetical protein ACFLUO_09305 [Chloroflexota bacterium]
MMKLSRHEDAEKCEQEVRLWLEKRLEKRGIPYERYKNLPEYNKVTLRNLVCIPTKPTTTLQRKDLYEKIIAGRELIDSLGSVPDDEEVKKIFSPLTPSEKLYDWEKY